MLEDVGVAVVGTSVGWGVGVTDGAGVGAGTGCVEGVGVVGMRLPSKDGCAVDGMGDEGADVGWSDGLAVVGAGLAVGASDTKREMAGPPPRGQFRPSFDAASAAAERRTRAAVDAAHWTWVA